MRNTTPELVLVRRSEFDDVYVPTVAEVYSPTITAPVASKKRSALGTSFTTMILVLSTALTYGAVASTGAYFADTELASANQFVTTQLDFAADAVPDNNFKLTPGGEPVQIPIVVTPSAESVSTNYRVTIEQTGGNVELCNALTANIVGGTPFVYSGSLLGLTGTASTNIVATLAISLPAPGPGLPIEEQCQFDVVFRGWNSAVSESTGYTDEERLSFVVTDPPLEVPLPEVPPENSVAPEPEIVPEPETVTRDIPTSVPPSVPLPDPAPQDPPPDQAPAPEQPPTL